MHETVRQNVDAAKKQASGYNYNYRYQYRQKYGGNAPNTTYRYGGKQNAKRQQPGTQGQQPGMQGVPRSSGRKPVNLSRGKGMTIWGGILAGIFGFVSAITLPLVLVGGSFGALWGAGAPLLGFLCLGLVLLFCGMGRTKKEKRFRKYLALIGTRESIAIQSLAQAMPASLHTACDDLQEMLDEGFLPAGYLDMGSGRLILSDEGLREEMPPEPEPQPEEEEPVDDDTYLEEIRQANDAIADAVMSRKIDRIGEITGKILEYQRKNPDRSGQLRSFLSYYLPTTLKILRAYAQMEAQGIEGENIRAAKVRIEGMMDKVVEGFEKQLDKLFEGDAMDITTDVEVLERMLDKDGLSGGGGGFQMGI
ncbi:MAG: 5-bromo-4-chloroindolyl phosphate hydrolysis family protein [Pseudoflavonifractor sp.]